MAAARLALPGLVLFFFAAPASAGVEGPPSETIEIYHVNPYHFGAVPINMNSGDVVGDLFFDLKQVLMNPLACMDKHSLFAEDCNNQETVAPDLVVNKVRLRVSGNYSKYAACNIGLGNNTDPFGNRCPEGQYCCICKDGHPGLHQNKTLPCNATAGRTTVQSAVGWWPNATLCNATAPEWICWQTKILDKLDGIDEGFWYSTLDYGYCPHHPDLPGNCTWDLESVDKIVNKSCHADSFAAAVEKYNASCFDGCGTARNVSSPCWVTCFYTTVLGPDAGRAGGKVAGVPTEKLVKAWLDPFASEDPTKGGCPGMPIPRAAHRKAAKAADRKSVV